jgi:exodeoxyribonuclease VII large subunit
MSDAQSPQSNVPEFSVGDLAFSLKKTLEDTFGRVRVRGELSRVSIAGSGHMYSSLKDDNAVIDAVCWKGVMSKLSIRPEEGMEVIVTGRVTTFPQRSNYQLVIESMELAGEGALLKMLEERKKKLAAEGLFAPERKRPLPFLPQVIGVVTSPTGAVIRDILHRLEDRFPRHVLVWPVLVQGDAAAQQVADAIEGFQSIDEGGIARPDLLIVARGGGSLEDLMPFNEEIVVRAIANSAIPVISAVGHETDTTLADYAADLRAPTPTGAAEMAVPVRAELQAQVLDNEQRLVSGAGRMLSERRHQLEAHAGRLGDPARLLEGYAQRLDHRGEQLSGVFQHYLARKDQRLIQAGAQLRTPQDRLREAQAKLDRWGEQLVGQSANMTRDLTLKLDYAGKMLEAYSFENVLQRGFSVVRDDSGALVQDGASLADGDAINVQFKGQTRVDAVVGRGDGVAVKPHIQPQKKPKSKPKAKSSADDQQSLF